MLRSVVLVSGAALLAGVLGGCLLSTRGAYVVDVAPPAPRYSYVEQRPGYLWIDGHWWWNGGTWAWADGYWEVERPGYAYNPGRWDRCGGRWCWHEGGWHGRGGGGTVVRDHRGGGDHRGSYQPTPYGRGGGTQVRDHRGSSATPQRGTRPKPSAPPARGPKVRDHRH